MEIKYTDCMKKSTYSNFSKPQSFAPVKWNNINSYKLRDIEIIEVTNA